MAIAGLKPKHASENGSVHSQGESQNFCPMFMLQKLNLIY